MASKVNEKINAIFDSKNSNFRSQTGSKMEPKWSPKSWNFVDIAGYPAKTAPRRPNGSQGAPKLSQNGAQREPNGGKIDVKASQNGEFQNGANMEPKRSQMELQGSPN